MPRAEQQPLIEYITEGDSNNHQATLKNNRFDTSNNQAHKPASKNLLIRAIRSRGVVVHILLWTMLFYAIFQLVGLSRPAEVTLILNWAVTGLYIAALHYVEGQG